MAKETYHRGEKGLLTLEYLSFISITRSLLIDTRSLLIDTRSLLIDTKRPIDTGIPELY